MKYRMEASAEFVILNRDLTMNDHEAMIADWGWSGPEGWAVFASYDGLQIERIDELEIFESDEQAWDHVAARVMAGSKPHIEALREVFSDNPSEAVSIRKHLGPALSRLVEERLGPIPQHREN